MRRIRIEIGPVTLDAELLDTPTAEAIYRVVPFASEARTWGDEVYFAARTNIWGRALGDVRQLKQVQSGVPISVEILPDSD